MFKLYFYKIMLHYDVFSTKMIIKSGMWLFLLTAIVKILLFLT